ncbi:MAG: hypothetical protein D6732_29345 [Methanobacteriota archaeon]|nr:MAG: hypothetical protein D6732_29345 [Euryarchaeota archaeon]
MIDLGALVAQLFSSFWWAIPLVVLAALFKSAWFKGVMCEFIMNLAARLFLNENDYHLIKNVTIPFEDGTTQKRVAVPLSSFTKIYQLGTQGGGL